MNLQIFTGKAQDLSYVLVYFSRLELLASGLNHWLLCGILHLAPLRTNY